MKNFTFRLSIKKKEKLQTSRNLSHSKMSSSRDTLKKFRKSLNKTSKLFDEVSKFQSPNLSKCKEKKSKLNDFEKLSKSIEEMNAISKDLMKQLKNNNKQTDVESDIETIILTDSETELENDLAIDLEKNLSTNFETAVDTNLKKNLAKNLETNLENSNTWFFSRFFNSLSFLTLLKRRKTIVITGSSDDEITSKFLKTLFNIQDYEPGKSMIANDSFEIYIETNLYKASFDKVKFKIECKKMLSKGLDYIICIGNLNPRPETIVNDLNKILDAFGANVCRQKIFFVFTSTQETSLDIIRNSFRHKHNKVVIDLRIKNNVDTFLSEKMWYFNENDPNSLDFMKIFL